MMRRSIVIVALVLATFTAAARAAPPEQFGVWGSAGPELPKLPPGWREAPPARAPATAWAPTAADRARGYVVFVRDPMSPPSPRDRGFAAEQVGELTAFAARGEYEPVMFHVHALEPLGKVRVEVGELRSAAGGSIPADHVDVRVVRCVRTVVSAKDKTFRLEPFLLETREAFDVAAGRTAQVWVTVKVPDVAEPGEYAAAVAVRPAGRPAATLKLTVRVLPFSLPPAPIEMAVFYPRPPADDAMLKKQLIDVREHGCNGVDPPLNVQVVSRDRTFGDDDVQATRAHCRRMLGAIGEVFGPRRRAATFSVGHQIACYWDKQKNWFVYWKHDEAIERDLLRAVDVVREAVQAAGGPPLRVYALDEAGAHGLLDEAVYYYGLLKRHRPMLGRWTSIGGGIAMGVDEIGGLSDCVDFLSTNRFTPAIARALSARGRAYGVYNGSRHDPASARFFHGFHGFKTGAQQIAQWCYHFGNGVFEGRGMRAADEGYVYLAADGPLPSVMWEAVREGIDDYRYVHLLRLRIAGAGASRNAEAKRAAAAAQRVLTDVIGRIGWGFQALTQGERTPTPHPSTLRKWRRRIAGQIVRLAGVLGPGARAPVRPAPPKPLELPWPAAPKVPLRYGPELLSAGGFEKGLAPWRVEAWSGKGAGTLDAATRHGGAKSVRIDVPAGGSSQAVTVLVWPSWGGGAKLDVQLAGQRVYELAAWVRWRGRSTPPAMRIALPQSATGPTQSGADDADASGWRRVWARAELKHPAVPKYLAVWVQGPGTVWVDDLSLREVLPRPVTLSLDQAAYDGLDPVGVASVVVGRGITPERLRFTLLRDGRNVVARGTAPFRARVPAAASDAGLVFLGPAELQRCEVIFSPASLTPGRYEAKVELLDAAGAPTASEAAAFERTAP